MRRTIYVVDDDAAVRDSLATLLAPQGFAVRTFASARAFLGAVTPEDTGCVVVDLKMPGMSGLDLLREMRARRLELPAVFITGHGDIQAAVAAMKAGAVDFLEKPFRVPSLIAAIESALQPHDDRAALAEKRRRLASLTARERGVLDLLAAGMTSREIGAKLGASARTIDAHRRSLLAKLEARNTADLVRIALTSGHDSSSSPNIGDSA